VLSKNVGQEVEFKCMIGCSLIELKFFDMHVSK